MDNIQFRQHQDPERITSKLDKSRGLILNHATGSGKTLTALAAFKTLKDKNLVKKALIIGPASLKENFPDNMKKFKLHFSHVVLETNEDIMKDADIYITTYEFAMRRRFEIVELLDYDIVIADELQKARNKNSKTFRTMDEVFAKAKYRLALTASATNNTAEELFALFDLVSGQRISDRAKEFIVPWQESIIRSVVKDFAQQTGLSKIADTFSFIQKFTGRRVKNQDPTIEVVDKRGFRNLLGDYYDYVDPKDIIGRPKEEIKYIDVEMTKEHSELYLAAMDKIDRILLKDFRKGKLKETRMSGLFTKLMAARQTLIDPEYMIKDNPEAKNINRALASGKIKQMLVDVKNILRENPEHFILVFTNFLGSGAKVVEASLNAMGVDNLIYTGELNLKQKREVEAKFKNKECRVLVLTSAGAEGLDFPFVSHVIIMDPHWNPEVMRQMRSRGVRVGSIWPVVKIRIYRSLLAVRTSFWTNTGEVFSRETVDHWILDVANRKTMDNVILKSALTGIPKDKISENLKSLKEVNEEFDINELEIVPNYNLVRKVFGGGLALGSLFLNGVVSIFTTMAIISKEEKLEPFLPLINMFLFGVLNSFTLPAISKIGKEAEQEMIKVVYKSEEGKLVINEMVRSHKNFPNAVKNLRKQFMLLCAAEKISLNFELYLEYLIKGNLGEISWDEYASKILKSTSPIEKKRWQMQQEDNIKLMSRLMDGSFTRPISSLRTRISKDMKVVETVYLKLYSEGKAQEMQRNWRL